MTSNKIQIQILELIFNYRFQKHVKVLINYFINDTERAISKYDVRFQGTEAS